ncbi:MAG: hypothetical protein GX753_04590, partial [Erysipelothrix sp.]|nr:hypothetical protein [Erysipelothrix sp.]
MKKLFKKPIAILVTIILMLQVVFVDVPMSVNAGSTLGNIFSIEHITIGGEKYTEASQIAFVDLEQGTKALLRFTWNTEGLNAKDKDTAHVKLNDVFKSFTNLTRRDILIDGVDPVGVFWIDNGVIWFEFDEGIEQGDVSHGFVEMELEFDLEKFDEQREHNIPFSEDEKSSLTIIARPKSTNTGIA